MSISSYKLQGLTLIHSGGSLCTSTSPPLQRMLHRLSGTYCRLSLNSSFQVCCFSLADVGAYCGLHIAFLIRALLKSRSGFERSDSLVRYFTRRVIQLGLFAVVWSLAGMATWFLLPKYTVFAFFDMTSGSIYTHVSSFLSQNPSAFKPDLRCYLIRSYPAPNCGSASLNGTTLRCGRLHKCGVRFTLIFDPYLTE